MLNDFLFFGAVAAEIGDVAVQPDVGVQVLPDSQTVHKLFDGAETSLPQFSIQAEAPVGPQLAEMQDVAPFFFHPGLVPLGDFYNEFNHLCPYFFKADRLFRREAFNVFADVHVHMAAMVRYSQYLSPMRTIPADLKKAITADPKAAAAWKDITPVARHDFIRWVETAKQAQTRTRRIAVACSKLRTGDRRPCCYAVVPMPLYSALGKNPKAKATWGTLTPDQRRELVDWIESPKPPETKADRIKTACVKLAAGKFRA